MRAVGASSTRSVRRAVAGVAALVAASTVLIGPFASSAAAAVPGPCPVGATCRTITTYPVSAGDSLWGISRFLLELRLTGNPSAGCATGPGFVACPSIALPEPTPQAVAIGARALQRANAVKLRRAHGVLLPGMVLAVPASLQAMVIAGPLPAVG